MSLKKEISYLCPHCGKEMKVEVYDSINVTLNPELREKVMSGDIFLHNCPHCNKEVYIPYATCYHDMDKKFMVYFNNIANLYDIYEDVKNANLNLAFSEIISKTTLCGATNPIDFVTNIIALENNLDFKVVMIVLQLMKYNYAQMREENHMKPVQIVAAGFTGNVVDGELEIFISYGDKEDETAYNTFPMEIYKETLNQTKPLLDLSKPFIFEETQASHFIYMSDEDIKKEIEEPINLYLVKNDYGDLELCRAGFVLSPSLNVGDAVIVQDSGKNRYRRTLKHIISTSFVFAPIYTTLSKIISTAHHMRTEITKNQDAVLENGELEEELAKFKKSKYKMNSKTFPTELLNEADMFICDVDEEHAVVCETNDIVIHNEKDRGEPIRRICFPEVISEGNKNYLALYTKEEELPLEKYAKPFVCDFNTLVRLVKCNHRYAGMIINRLGNSIKLTFDQLFEYIVFKTFTIDENMKNFLNLLNDLEIQIVGEKSYELIRDVYFNSLKPKQLETKYSLSKDEVDELLDIGYGRMSHLAYEKF